MIFSKQQRHNAYQNLNDEAKNFASSQENLELITSIGQKYQLDESHSDTLDSEAYYVMLGLQTAQEMAEKLKAELSLPDEKISELVNDLKSQIFNQLDAIKNGTTKDTPDRFVQTPTSLKSTASQVPSNLPTGEVSEEKILSSVGSPGEKLAWEQRKQIAANALPKVEEKKYSGVDPYREPLQ